MEKQVNGHSKTEVDFGSLVGINGAIAIFGGDARTTRLDWPNGQDIRFFQSKKYGGLGESLRLLESLKRGAIGTLVLMTKFMSHAEYEPLRKAGRAYAKTVITWDRGAGELSRILLSIAPPPVNVSAEVTMLSVSGEVVEPAKTASDLPSFIISVHMQDFVFGGNVKRLLCTVDVTKLNNWSVNPESRTVAPKNLLEAVKESGAVLIPGYIYQDGTIIDCHGRRAVAAEAGIGVMLAFVCFCSEEFRHKIFQQLNTTPRLFSGSQQIEVCANTGGKVRMGKSSSNAYDTLRNVGYADSEINKVKTSPSLINKVRRLVSLVVQYELNKRMSSDDVYRLVFDFIQRNNLSKSVDMFLNVQTKNRTKKLWELIRNKENVTNSKFIEEFIQ